jgi:alkylation response protein AidB-like acyl-CoA dehydrogenase
MDLEFTDVQSALVDSLHRLTARHAGPVRARHVLQSGQCDRDLMKALGAAGFLDLASSDGAGPLEAEIVVEEVAKAAGVAPIGVRSLVAPRLLEEPVPEIVAICEAAEAGPVRFAAAADLIIVLDGDSAGVLRPEPGEIVPVESPYGAAMGHLPDRPADLIAPGGAEIARRWWRVAIAAEIAGRLTAALDLTVRYAKERSQFDRPIGSFQVVQHRLAQLHVASQQSTWLARAAAWSGDAEIAAAAAVFSSDTARWASVDLHQLTGAIGFTEEYDLHLWTMPLQALRVELGGLARHSRDLVTARWIDPAETGR